MCVRRRWQQQKDRGPEGGRIGAHGKKAYRRVAVFLKRRVEFTPNEKLVVVVSAQKLATDTLERRARHIVRTPGVRALDLLWSTAELRSVALMALYLQEAGVLSVGLNVHETGLQYPSKQQACAAQPSLMGAYLKGAVAEHAVVVVPGFLATRWDSVIVSLGRGGSDFSAVLLAIGLTAARCELIKDVPGYFENDPRENARSRKVSMLSQDTYTERSRSLSLLASAGVSNLKDFIDGISNSSVVSPKLRTSLSVTS